MRFCRVGALRRIWIEGVLSRAGKRGGELIGSWGSVIYSSGGSAGSAGSVALGRDERELGGRGCKELLGRAVAEPENALA